MIPRPTTTRSDSARIPSGIAAYAARSASARRSSSWPTIGAVASTTSAPPRSRRTGRDPPVAAGAWASTSRSQAATARAQRSCSSRPSALAASGRRSPTWRGCRRRGTRSSSNGLGGDTVRLQPARGPAEGARCHRPGRSRTSASRAAGSRARSATSCQRRRGRSAWRSSCAGRARSPPGTGWWRPRRPPRPADPGRCAWSGTGRWSWKRARRSSARSCSFARRRSSLRMRRCPTGSGRNRCGWWWAGVSSGDPGGRPTPPARLPATGVTPARLRASGPPNRMAARLHMKLGLVAEPERLEDSPDTVAIVEPTIGATARSKGSLFLVVTAVGRGRRLDEATRLVADTIQAEYYYDESAGLVVCLEKAIRAANRRLLAQRERLGLGTGPTGPIGIGLAVVRGNELYVVTTGPAEAYLVRQAHLLTLPDAARANGLPMEEVTPEVWRGEGGGRDSRVLVSSNPT